MKTDRITKLLLALIAAGLWLDVASSLIRPTPTRAQDPYDLHRIQRDLDSIARGTCLNNKIC
jgi:hypothetical protein